MAKVFTGKVMIPAEKLDDYFALLKKAEEERKPFREILDSLSEEFYQYLEDKYSERTARKHCEIIGIFIDFLCQYTDVQRIEDVTKGMVNTHFKLWWKRKVWASTTPEEITAALTKFFKYLDEEKNIVNEKALQALKQNG